MTTATEAPCWRHVGIFLGLTFALTWLLNLTIFLAGGLAALSGLGTMLQLQMLLPAFSAIVLGLFFFKESPLHVSKKAGRGRWFYYYFLLLTVLYVAGSVGAALQPSLQPTVSAVTGIMTIVGLLLLIALRLVGGREAMARVWLAGGKPIYWLLFGVGIVAYYGLQTFLNYVFGLGQPADLTPFLVQTGMDRNTLTIALAVQGLLVGPFMGLVIAFGEEYGWRGYLQSELVKLGRVRGVALLGVIWGLWHAPVILMGYNYPGYPLLGVLIMTLYTVGLAFVLGYAVLKTGSVLLAAYLHALNNQVVSIFAVMIYTQRDMAFSFGIGIYGLVTLAIVVLLIVRDPLWRQKGSNLS
jgi:uncharacterized protein